MIYIMQYEVLYIMIILLESSEIQDDEKLRTVIHRTLVHIMAWRRPGDKPFSEPMMVSLPTHICVARPQ